MLNLFISKIVTIFSCIIFVILLHTKFHDFSATNDTMSGDLISTIVKDLTEISPTPSILDSYVCTLVKVLKTNLPDKLCEHILDAILDLFMAQETTAATCNHALRPLTKFIGRYKKHILHWSAKAMSSSKHNPKLVLKYLVLIYASDSANTKNQRKFVLDNLYHLLPSIILNPDKSGSDTIEGADSTLDMISG